MDVLLQELQRIFGVEAVLLSFFIGYLLVSSYRRRRTHIGGLEYLDKFFSILFAGGLSYIFIHLFASILIGAYNLLFLSNLGHEKLFIPTMVLFITGALSVRFGVPNWGQKRRVAEWVALILSLTVLSVVLGFLIIITSFAAQGYFSAVHRELYTTVLAYGVYFFLAVPLLIFFLFRSWREHSILRMGVDNLVSRIFVGLLIILVVFVASLSVWGASDIRYVGETPSYYELTSPTQMEGLIEVKSAFEIDRLNWLGWFPIDLEGINASYGISVAVTRLVRSYDGEMGLVNFSFLTSELKPAPLVEEQYGLEKHEFSQDNSSLLLKFDRTKFHDQNITGFVVTGKRDHHFREDDYKFEIVDTLCNEDKGICTVDMSFNNNLDAKLNMDNKRLFGSQTLLGTYDDCMIDTLTLRELTDKPRNFSVTCESSPKCEINGYYFSIDLRMPLVPRQNAESLQVPAKSDNYLQMNVSCG